MSPDFRFIKYVFVARGLLVVSTLKGGGNFHLTSNWHLQGLFFLLLRSISYFEKTCRVCPLCSFVRICIASYLPPCKVSLSQKVFFLFRIPLELFFGLLDLEGPKHADVLMPCSGINL